jgi:isoaspartyl peptidase/L-asparaginase-like protein (Ntn-hydrolase superfamily)
MTTLGRVDAEVEDSAVALRGAVAAVEELDDSVEDALIVLAPTQKILDTLQGRTSGLVLSHEDAAATAERLHDVRTTLEAIRADLAHTLTNYNF